MVQTYKWFTAEQVAALLKGYYQGILDRTTIEEVLGIGKTRFFALLKQYYLDPNNFSLVYRRETSSRLPARVEKEIERELMLDKNLVEDPSYLLFRSFVLPQPYTSAKDVFCLRVKRMVNGSTRYHYLTTRHECRMCRYAKEMG
jgi:hypothetical protein